MASGEAEFSSSEIIRCEDASNEEVAENQIDQTQSLPIAAPSASEAEAEPSKPLVINSKSLLEMPANTEKPKEEVDPLPEKYREMLLEGDNNSPKPSPKAKAGPQTARDFTSVPSPLRPPVLVDIEECLVLVDQHIENLYTWQMWIDRKCHTLWKALEESKNVEILIGSMRSGQVDTSILQYAPLYLACVLAHAAAELESKCNLQEGDLCRFKGQCKCKNAARTTDVMNLCRNGLMPLRDAVTDAAKALLRALGSGANKQTERTTGQAERCESRGSDVNTEGQQLCKACSQLPTVLEELKQLATASQANPPAAEPGVENQEPDLKEPSAQEEEANLWSSIVKSFSRLFTWGNAAQKAEFKFQMEPFIKAVSESQLLKQFVLPPDTKVTLNTETHRAPSEILQEVGVAIQEALMSKLSQEIFNAQQHKNTLSCFQQKADPPGEAVKFFTAKYIHAKDILNMLRLRCANTAKCVANKVFGKIKDETTCPCGTIYHVSLVDGE